MKLAQTLKVDRLLKMAGVVGGLATAASGAGYATIRVMGVETEEAHKIDIDVLRKEERFDKDEELYQNKLLRGMVECLMRDIKYERCPAVKADFLK